jgi:hypothetical protein
MILEKTSFSRKLFKKEYRKTFRYLAPNEQFELKGWLRSKMKKEDRQEKSVRITKSLAVS